MLRLLCVLVVATMFAFTSTDRAAGHEVDKCPSFVRVGDKFYIRPAFDLPEQPKLVKVLEFGPHEWVKVEELLSEFDLPVFSRRDQPKDTRQVGDSLNRTFWLNFGTVAAASPDANPVIDKAGSDQGQPAVNFPTVGTSYYIRSSAGILPFLAKVLETSASGWFRVMEVPYGINPHPKRPREWWINGTVVSQLTEAKLDDAASSAKPQDQQPFAPAPFRLEGSNQGSQVRFGSASYVLSTGIVIGPARIDYGVPIRASSFGGEGRRLHWIDAPGAGYFEQRRQVLGR